jgi:hypothetical protein
MSVLKVFKERRAPLVQLVQQDPLALLVPLVLHQQFLDLSDQPVQLVRPELPLQLPARRVQPERLDLQVLQAQLLDQPVQLVQLVAKVFKDRQVPKVFKVFRVPQVPPEIKVFRDL